MDTEARLKAAHLVNAILIVCLFFAAARYVLAVTPNPGHPWTEVGDGVFAVTGPTVARTFTFPDANATVLTTNTAVTAAQGGTGLSSFTQGDIVYASAANTLSALAKNTTATRYLSNTGSSNNPAWAQIDMTNGVTGILPSTNGGTGNGFTKFSGPTTAERTFTLPDASATVLTSNTPVTVAQGGTGLATLTANNVILGNGTSNPTFVAPSTSGNVLTSNGTTWTSAAASGGTLPDPVIFTPVGQNQTALNAVTALTTGLSHFIYVGAAAKAYTSCTVLLNVTTAVATITWAEVAVFKGSPPLNGAGSLTRLGFTSVAATFNSTGIKSTAVSLTGSAIGDNLWIAYGSQATTPFQVRGMLADNIQTGTFQTDTIRPSLAASPEATAVAGATIVPAWTAMRCT